MKRAGFLFLSFFFAFLGKGQNNFTQPFIHQFTKSEYGAGTQNWQIDQGASGIIYIANNDGLLTFNGSDWKLHPLPNKTICRSVEVVNSRIYVGGQGELGYFEPNEKGALRFVAIPFPDSLKGEDFDDFWNIEQVGKTLYFFSTYGIISYTPSNNQSSLLSFGSSITYMGAYKEGILVQELNKGFYYLNEEEKIPIPSLDSLKNTEVSACFAFRGGFVIATLHNGLFKYRNENLQAWKTNFHDFFVENTIYKAVAFQDDQIICGTSQGGLVLLNHEGMAQLVLQKVNGLQNNNVLSIFVDNEENLWLGLDNGIDFIELNSPFKQFYPDGFLEGTSYTGKKWKNKLIVGTVNGVYQTSWNAYQNPTQNNSFKPFLNLKGQVWNLSLLDSSLFIHLHDGLFQVQEGKAIKLGPHQGSWNLHRLKLNPNYCIEGTYRGLNLYQFQPNGTLRFLGRIKGFTESSRFVEQDEKGRIWVAHPYKGVFKCHLDTASLAFSSIERYDQAKGFESKSQLKVFQLKKINYFLAENGIYRYNEQKDYMYRDTSFEAIFGGLSPIRFLYQGSEESLWFVTAEENVGKVNITYEGLEQRFELEVFPSIKGKLVNGFEFIHQIDSTHTILGAEKGMIMHKGGTKKLTKAEHFVIIDAFRVEGTKDSTLLVRYLPSSTSNKITLTPDQQNITFQYSAPIFSGADNVEYRYQLEGFDKAGSPWTSETKKEYTNLPPGKYTFKVWARLAGSFTTPPTFIHFKILPPWYKTRIAYGSYIAICLLFLFGLIFFPQMQFRKEKKIMETQQARKLQQKDIEHSKIVASRENEMMKLKNEKLRNEINFKNQELATSTMNLVQKTEILSKIKQELGKAKESYDDPKVVNGQVKKVIKMINENVRLDKNWDQFAHHFDKVHVDFNKRLKEKFPELTPNEKKLCAYLRMNLTTKEIAPLMNISVRGVEISRYRLRKKLDLDRDENLNEFIAEI